MAFNDWSTNPANNTLVGDINWSEGQLPSTVNGSARQMMADVASFRDYLYGTSSPFALLTGAAFIGPVTITYAGSPSLKIISPGVVSATLACQADGNIVLYRNTGGSDAPLFSAGNDGRFNVIPQMYRSGNLVWDAGNDGAGSGLDSDLLDGQQGAFYTDIPARLGYSPVSRAGDAMSGSLSIVFAGNPGLSLNSSGVAIGRLVMQNDGNLVLYRNNGGGDVPVFGVSSQIGPFAVSMPITRQGYTVWDAGNDGAGSGLDADLWRGQAPSAFQPAMVAESLVENGGYTVHPGGKKECWGFVTMAQDSSAIFTLPVAHTSWVNPSIGPQVRFNSSANENTGIIAILGSPPTGIQLYNAENQTVTVWIKTVGV